MFCLRDHLITFKRSEKANILTYIKTSLGILRPNLMASLISLFILSIVEKTTAIHCPYLIEFNKNPLHFKPNFVIF